MCRPFGSRLLRVALLLVQSLSTSSRTVVVNNTFVSNQRSWRDVRTFLVFFDDLFYCLFVLLFLLGRDAFVGRRRHGTIPRCLFRIRSTVRRAIRVNPGL